MLYHQFLNKFEKIELMFFIINMLQKHFKKNFILNLNLDQILLSLHQIVLSHPH